MCFPELPYKMYQKLLIIAILALFLGGIFLFSIAVYADTSSQINEYHIDYFEESGTDKIFLSEYGSTSVNSWAGNTALQKFNCPIDYPYYRTGSTYTRCYKSCTVSDYIDIAGGAGQANSSPDYLSYLFLDGYGAISTTTYPLQVISYRVDDSITDGVFYGPYCNSGSNPIDFFLIWDFNNNLLGDDTFLTRISSTTPQNQATVATSTEFLIGTGGFFSFNDYDPNSTYYLKLSFYPEGTVGLGDTSVRNVVEQFYEWEIFPGFFNVSTTTNISQNSQLGRYSMTAYIYEDNWLWTGRILTSTTTQFIVATSTLYDLLVDSQENALDDYFAGLADDCDFSLSSLIDFGVGGQLYRCVSSFLVSLVIPSHEQASKMWSNFEENILERFPIGYIHRIFEIFQETRDIASAPNFTIYIPPNFTNTGLDDTYLTFPIMEAIANIDDTLSGYELYSSGDNAYDALYYVWKYILILGFALYLFRRLTTFKF